MKVCKYCGKEFNREEKKVARPGYGTVHDNCLLLLLIDKYGDNDYTQNKYKEIIKKRDEKKKLVQQKNINESEEHKKNKEARFTFFKYIETTYNISLNKRQSIKISQIVNGSYKGLKDPIPYEDLLEMFKSKQKTLLKIYQRNITKGNKIDPNYRFDYDLSILVNKYDSFKKWKRNKEIQAAELKINKVKEEEDKKIDFNKISEISNSNEQEDGDISDILDDIL